jgi:putative sigma-54 modulation protein
MTMDRVSTVVTTPEAHMIWELKDKGARRPKELPDLIERRLRFALARFGSRIQKTVVFLQDDNGPRGGIDKVCRILVKTRGCGVIVAAVVDSDWLAAVDRATARIGHSVARQIERLRSRQGLSPRKPVRDSRSMLGAG